jgi:O-antigen ligase
MRAFLATTLVYLFLPGGEALAESPVGGGVNPGERIGTWLYQNVTALFIPILAAISLYYLARRQFTQFLSFAAFAVLATLFIYGGTEFKDAAVGLTKWVIGK